MPGWGYAGRDGAAVRHFIAIAALGALVSGLACSQRAPTAPAMIEWEHGWQTTNVIATRYRDGDMGYNIGFAFPNDPNNCDAMEIDDLMRTHGGMIYEGGGYPGAVAYVVFKDVTDRESADRKLKHVLPELDRLMVRIR